MRFLLWSGWPEWIAAPRAQLALGAAGALLGLGIAGYGLFTAQNTRIGGVPAEDAAIVEGVPVLRSDLAQQIETATGRPEAKASAAERRGALDAMIDEELMVRRGLELDQPSTDPDTRAALVSAVQAQIAVDATSAVPDEAALRAYYAEHRAHYAAMGEMTVRDLIPRSSASPGDLAAAADALRHEPVAAVIARYSLRDSGRVGDDELYFAARIHLGNRLFGAAQRLADGQVAGPIAAADGPHLLVMVHHLLPQPEAYARARPQVYSDYKQALEARLRAGESRFLRGRATIQIAPDLR